MCNDGLWETGEECDNGGTNTDGCTDSCTIDTGDDWRCDSSIVIDNSESSECYLCGDGLWAITEDCDDGDADDTDGCLSDCTIDPLWTCHSGDGLS